MELKEAGGKTLPAIAVFTLSIKALKDHLLDMLDTRGTTLQAEEVLWVLTVPAIWTDSAKFFMRKAALRVIFCTFFILIFFIEFYLCFGSVYKFGIDIFLCNIRLV